LSILLTIPSSSFGQGTTCASADPFCSGSATTFPAGTNQPEAETTDPGNDYECLSDSPNPAWYFMEIDNGGSMTIDMTNNGCGGTGCDIDFILWGPFPDVTTATSNCGSLTSAYDCSFDPQVAESTTITGAVSGDVYLLLITNYSNSATDISFTNTSGSATTNCAILPIELTTFYGQCTNGVFELYWSTLTEFNNNYFTIEKSDDGINFYPIGKVNSKSNGFSTNPNSYSFVDDNPSENAYYRLKQTDFDGSFTYYTIISGTCVPFKYDIYPNPFKDELTINVPTLGDYDLEIRDYLGRLIYRRRLDYAIIQTVDLSFLNTSGMYFISMFNKNHEVLVNEKFLKY
jgi:hypothetical protein